MKKRGFTLIELIVVIAVLAILALLAVPAYRGIIGKSRKSVCEENRRQIAHLTDVSLALENENLEKLLKQNSTDSSGTAEITSESDVDEILNEVGFENQNDKKLCPSDGKYTIKFTWDGNNYKIYVYCTEHEGGIGNDGDDSGSGPNPDPEGDKIPGTDIDISTDIWPKQDQFKETWDQQTVESGKVFEYDGKYYIATGPLSVSKTDAANGPSSIAQWGNLIEFTNNIYTRADTSQNRITVNKGDIYTADNGTSYVFNIQSGKDVSLPAGPGNDMWYKLN